MKRWILLVLVLVASSAAGTLLVQWWTEGEPGDRLLAFHRTSARLTGNEPRAVVEGNLNHDFGTLPQRVTGKHAWVVRNTGKSDLELWMISSTCSCTLAKFKDGHKAVVKPGESTEIVLEYETRENNGDYSKGAEIGTNDPRYPSFSLAAVGKVYPPVMTFPAEPVVLFGTISNDVEDNAARVAVFSLDRPETKVTKVTTSNPNVTGEVKPLSAEDMKTLPMGAQLKRGEQVVVHVKPGVPLGNFREEVVIATDHPKMPELRLTAAGKMTGPISLIPGIVSMHDVYAKAGATQEVVLMVAQGRATKFTVEKKPDPIQVEVAPAQGAKAGRYRLVVTVPPGTPPGRIEADVVLATDHPRAAQVIVPVSIWVLNSN